HRGARPRRRQRRARCGPRPARPCGRSRYVDPGVRLPAVRGRGRPGTRGRARRPEVIEMEGGSLHDIEPRAAALARCWDQENHRKTDRMFARLMLVQWAAGIAAALWISPRAWTGGHSQTHPHVWAAIGLG